MRFLILTQYFPPEAGAAQIRLLALARELQQRGHAVRVVTALPNYPRGEIFPGYRGRWIVRESVDGIAVTRTWIYPATGSNILKRLLNYWSFTITSLIGGLQGDRPDWIFVESPPLFLGLSGYLCSRLRRTPFILNVSDLWPESARALGLVRNRALLWLGERLERFLYARAARVCAVTEGIVAEIGAISRTPQKVMWLPNGVDTSTFAPVAGAAMPSLGPGQVGFLYAGTHGYAQALDTILGAADRLRDRPDVVFIMVGEGPEKARLRQLAERRGLTNVRFVDAQPVSAMPGLFSASRASIVPLRRSPLFRSARPSKIFPSLACAAPVIFCGEGDVAALLAQHDCGLVVEPENAEQLAATVRRLTDDPALAHRLGANGRALVIRDYGWGTIVERWLGELTSGAAPAIPVGSAS